MTVIHTIKISGIGLILMGTLSACLTTPVHVPVVAKKAPVSVSNSDDLALMRLGRIRVNIAKGQSIGAYERERLFINNCYGSGGPIHWPAEPSFMKTSEFSGIFNSEMRKANFNVSTESDELFSSRQAAPAKPKFLVGGQIESLTMKVCDESDLWSGRRLNHQSGQSSTRVSWQLFDTWEQKVVYKTTTRGSVDIKKAIPFGQEMLIKRAFAAAAANLAADRNLVALLKKKQQANITKTEPVSGAPRWILPVPNWTVPITKNIDQIRQSIVTIEAGSSHGSGFFISPSLLLTNQHVVAGADRVRIRLLTGEKIVGAVLRKHVQRDVALIQVAHGGYKPLPIRTRPLVITEDVFALGTPLDKSLSGTVTKGIVSKFMLNEFQLVDIQADVDIQPGNSGGALLDNNGNVVGVTYAGIGNTSVGINFFVPISDALIKLNVQQRGALTSG